MPLLIISSGCSPFSKDVDTVPAFIFKVQPIALPVTDCADEPAVPKKLAAVPKSPRPTDIEALNWAEDVRVAGDDCRSGVKANKKYQDKHNSEVEAFNKKADEEAKKLK